MLYCVCCCLVFAELTNGRMKALDIRVGVYVRRVAADGLGSTDQHRGHEGCQDTGQSAVEKDVCASTIVKNLFTANGACALE